METSSTSATSTTELPPLTYTVVRGDSLYGIASKTDTPISALLSLNGLTLRSVIHPGQVLLIAPRSTTTSSSSSSSSQPSTTTTVPAGTRAVGVYVVQSGDSLYRIASTTKTPINDLLRLNRLTLSSRILPGQLLKILSSNPTGRGTACERVYLVGDSLTVASDSQLRELFASTPLVAVIDGVGFRRVPVDAERPYSGVLAVRDLRAQYEDADCWIVALGTNDARFVEKPDMGGYAATSVSTAQALVSMMIGEINGTGPHQIWWVNVHNRILLTGSVVINNVLWTRPDVRTIDFYSESKQHPEWFVDGAHLTTAGSYQRSLLTYTAIPY